MFHISADQSHTAADDKHVDMHARMCAHQYGFYVICISDPSGILVNTEFTLRANINEGLCVYMQHLGGQQGTACMCAHLPVEDNAPDEAQGQLVVPIHNICSSYVYQINLKEEGTE